MCEHMNEKDFSLSSLPPISMKFPRVVIFICHLQLESEVDCFTMKQTRNFLSTKSLLSSVLMSFTMQFLFSANLFCSCLLAIEPTFTPPSKMHTVEVINCQLREFQVLEGKTKQSSQQAKLMLITGKHQIKTNSHNFRTRLRATDHESWAFIEREPAIHMGDSVYAKKQVENL